MNRAVVLAMMAVGAGAGSLVCGSAFAQGADENDEGFYIGGGVGQFNLKLDDVDQTDEAIERLDDSDTAWKAFVGWRMNPYFALEAAYVDFGDTTLRALARAEFHQNEDQLRTAVNHHMTTIMDKVGTDIQFLSPRPFQLMHSEIPTKIVHYYCQASNDVNAMTVKMGLPVM